MTKPMELTLEEKKEIAAMGDVTEMWGVENEAEFVAMFDDQIYAAKFDYVSGGPGYCGDLIVLFGDGGFENINLIRRDGKLVIA